MLKACVNYLLLSKIRVYRERDVKFYEVHTRYLVKIFFLNLLYKIPVALRTCNPHYVIEIK